MAIKKGKIITITSVKGGVGKTTFLLTLASIYKNYKNKVLILDFDISNGDIAPILNCDTENDLYTLYEDFINNKYTDIDNYITKYSDNIDILPSPKDPRNAGKITAKYISYILSQVSTRYDYILVDTSHVLNDINLVTFDSSDQIIYVINNNSMNLKSMRTMISIFNDMNLNKYKILLYDAKDKNKQVYSKLDIRTLIKDNIDYIITKDFHIKNIEKLIIDGKILDIQKNISRKSKLILEHIAKDIVSK